MSKQEFLAQLRIGLSGLPQKDIDEHLTFYGEMIEDRIEEGLTEEEAVSAVGSVEEIVAQIVAETPFTTIAKERIKPKRQLKAWGIVLLALGSPIWFSLGIAAVAIIISLYISLWSVIISLCSVVGALTGSSFGITVIGVVLAFMGNMPTGIALTGAGIVCAGLSIFMFFGCKAATKGILILTKKIAVCIKNCFIKKEEA